MTDTEKLPVKLIVFDCDGTLVNGLARITESLNAGWDKAGLPKTDFGNVAHLVGLPLENIVQRYLPDDQHHLVPKIARDYRANYDGPRDKNSEEPFFDGIRALLDWAHGTTAVLGIATGKVRRGLDGILDHYKIPHYFITLQTSDQGPGKPHPAMLERAMREAKADPRQTVMIGDTTYDMQMAKSAGATALGVIWGYHSREDLKQAGADEIFETAAQLRSYLETWIKA